MCLLSIMNQLAIFEGAIHGRREVRQQVLSCLCHCFCIHTCKNGDHFIGSFAMGYCKLGSRTCIFRQHSHTELTTIRTVPSVLSKTSVTSVGVVSPSKPEVPWVFCDGGGQFYWIHISCFLIDFFSKLNIFIAKKDFLNIIFLSKLYEMYIAPLNLKPKATSSGHT